MQGIIKNGRIRAQASSDEKVSKFVDVLKTTDYAAIRSPELVLAVVLVLGELVIGPAMLSALAIWATLDWLCWPLKALLGCVR
jgi:hypothetical protein